MDFKVSRIQHRRGLQQNLPQPLLLGQFGWCFDTNKLFIGGHPDHVLPGVQVMPGFYPSAEAAANSQFVTVEVTPTTFVFADFVTHMSAFVPATQLYYQTGDTFAYVLLDVGQIGTWPTTGPFITSFPGVISATQGLAITVDANGTFATVRHSDSNAFCYLINQEQNNTIAVTKLNVPICTGTCP